MNVKMLVFLGLAMPWLSHASARQVLPGHQPATVARIQPVGRLAPTNQLHLAIGLPLRDPAALDALLQDLYNPASRNYRRFLTPAQFTARFGPTEADYQAAGDFAEAHGLRVIGTHPNRLLLDVQGSAADIEKAFHLKLGVFPHPAEARTFFSPDTEPSIDGDLAVLHISGLHNFTTPYPMSQRADPADPAAIAVPRAGTGPGGSFMGKDFRAAYAPGVTLTGQGQSIGLFELDGFYASDITDYEQQAGLPNVPLKTVLVGGFRGTPTSRRSGSGNEEVALDIEMAISMAPGASQILVYEGSPFGTTAVINDILNRMATDNAARQLSCSWGFDIDATTQQIFQQFAAQGQSFFLASGDSGAFSGPIFQPSDNPYITVVGGTTLTTSSSGAWVSEVVWSGSGGGISATYPIPEWQRGISMTASKGSPTMRNLPDVAMVANNVWCHADQGLSFALIGTSIAAPLWAGFTALVNEQAAAQGKPPVGFLNPALYQIGKSANYSKAFHDIKTGKNTTSASPSKFYAVAGYDLCTGWGTPTGSALIDALLALSTDDLVITPPLGFTAIGPVGGPFKVAATDYSLTNAGNLPLSWSMASLPAWLEAHPQSGVLAPGGAATTVTVSLSPAASELLIGNYSAAIWFTNLSNGAGQSRLVDLLAGDGGFEMGKFSLWTLTGDARRNFADSLDASLLAGTSHLAGVDDSHFVHSGLYGAFLGQSNSLGTLSQKLPTQVGQHYVVSFWLANPATGTPNEFRARWNGDTLFDQSDLGRLAWTHLQYIVTATNTASTLEFGFRNDLGAFALDDISVQPLAPPVLQSVSLNQGTLTFSVNSIAGFKYQAQFASAQDPSSWNDLGGLFTATSGTLAFSDTLGPDSQRFYRVLILP